MTVAEVVELPPGIARLIEPLCRTHQQVIGTGAFLRWAANTPEARAAAGGVVTIHRSVPQLVGGMGLQRGPNIRATQNRWAQQVKRWVRYLAPLGITYETAPVGPDGRGTGILVRIPAGVAQSVRAAES